MIPSRSEDSSHGRQRSPDPRQPRQRTADRPARRPKRARPASRANAYKHGLTGAGVVIPEREAAEVERRAAAFFEELNPTGRMGEALVRRMAVLSTRMERSVEQENAALTIRVRRAELDFMPPEGVDEAEAAQLRKLAGKAALFDPSKEATLARKYELAAERGFFRAWKELRAHEKAVRAADDALLLEESASFSPDVMTDEEFDAFEAEFSANPAPKAPSAARPVDFAPIGGRTELPFSIGRPR